MAASIGYARVSSADQSTDTQVDRLKAAGCSVIRVEKVSGRSRDGRLNWPPYWNSFSRVTR